MKNFNDVVIQLQAVINDDSMSEHARIEIVKDVLNVIHPAINDYIYLDLMQGPYTVKEKTHVINNDVKTITVKKFQSENLYYNADNYRLSTVIINDKTGIPYVIDYDFSDDMQ